MEEPAGGGVVKSLDSHVDDHGLSPEPRGLEHQARVHICPVRKDCAMAISTEG